MLSSIIHLVMTLCILLLFGQINFLIVFSNWKPRCVTCCETSLITIVPMVGSPGRVSGVQVVGIFVSSVASLHVHCIFPGNVAVSHANLLALVGDGGAGQHHVQRVETVHHVVTEPRRHSVVVVVAKLKTKPFTLLRILFSL